MVFSKKIGPRLKSVKSEHFNPSEEGEISYPRKIQFFPEFLN